MGINCDTDILGLFCMCVNSGWIGWIILGLFINGVMPLVKYCRWVILTIIVILSY